MKNDAKQYVGPMGNITCYVNRCHNAPTDTIDTITNIRLMACERHHWLGIRDKNLVMGIDIGCTPSTDMAMHDHYYIQSGEHHDH